MMLGPTANYQLNEGVIEMVKFHFHADVEAKGSQ
jgi:hypothetical protein